MGEVKLNLGAGQTYLPGFCNIDACPWADVQLDFGTDRLPFEDSSVDCVFSHHTLEHVPDYLHILGEVHRILRHGGRLLVGLPYVTSTMYHLVNPYHLHNFNEFSFDFFEPGKLKGSASEANGILFRKVFHRFNGYLGVFRWTPDPLRTWCRNHLFNVVRFIDFGLYAIKPPHEDLQIMPGDAERMKQEFDDCLRHRLAYSAERMAAAAHRV
jgi:SAM-dependent methyltransferase